MTASGLPDPIQSRSSDDTKARILEAAQQCFSQQGYGQIGIREIARTAGVAPSLVMRYYENKEKLFELAFGCALDMAPMLAAERERFGETTVALMSEERTNTVLSTSILALSIGDPQSRAIAVRLMEDSVIAPLAEWLDGPQRRARAEFITMLTMGYTALRLLVPINRPDRDEVAAVSSWMARVLQAVADGDPPPSE